jgi:Chromosome segregation ATPases
MSDNIIKPATFRLNEEDINRFKEFASQNNLNQQEAFTSLLNTLELNNAKSALGERAKSIEVFQTTINSLVKFYINSLEENTTTEERIREELSQQINTKDNAISALYEQLQDIKIERDSLKNQISELEDKNKLLSDKNDKLEGEIIDKSKAIEIANRNNSNLQDQVAEYKEYKNINIELEKNLESLKKDNNLLVSDKTSLGNVVTKLQGEIDNKDNMINFYKEQVEKLTQAEKDSKAEIKDLQDKYSIEINSLKDKYTEEIDKLKVDHKVELENSLKELEERLIDKNNLELQKKDLELQKLQNDNENLMLKVTVKE